MGRLLTMAAFLVGITCALAASNTTTPNNWIVYNDSKACLHMNATVTVEVTFMVNATTKANHTLMEPLPDTATVDNSTSKCGNHTSQLTVQWNEGKDLPYNITFLFMKGSKKWNVSHVNVFIPVRNNAQFNDYIWQQNFTNITADYSKQLLQANLNQSYLCNSNESYTFKVHQNTNGTLSVKVKLSDLRAQAFSFKKNGTVFDSANECSADNGGHSSNDNNKIVPIAVGAALAGLVIIVLVAYLIGRFRSRKSTSYEPL